MSSYLDRLSYLQRDYTRAEKLNEQYLECNQELTSMGYKLQCMLDLQHSCTILDNLITANENEWRKALLSRIEEEIYSALSVIFPNDGYNVSLDFKVVRGKIKIDSKVTSYITGKFPGRIKKTQGGLFKQVVSFAAIIAIMKMQGFNTVYIDEAFSDSSKSNIPNTAPLFQKLRSEGFNFVVIAQDENIASGVDCHVIRVSRTADNKTYILK